MGKKLQISPKQKLHESLVSEGLYSKSYPEFEKQFSTPESVEKLHKGLVDEGLYTKNLDDFNTQFNFELKKKVEPEPTLENSPKQPEISSVPSPEIQTGLTNILPSQEANGNNVLPSGLTEQQDKDQALETLRKEWDEITGNTHRPLEGGLPDKLPIDLTEKTPEQVRAEYDKQKRAEQGAKDYVAGVEDKESNPFVTFGKSIWNTLAYELPSSLAAAAATMGNNPDTPSAEAMFPDFSKPLGAPGHRTQEQITNATKANMLEWASKHQEKGQELTKDLVSTMDKVKDPIDAMNWLSYALGQATGQIPASVATAGASSIGQEVGSIYLDGVKKIAQDHNLSIQQVIDQKLDNPALAVAFGTASGLLDFVGAKGALHVPKKSLISSLRKRATDLVKSGGTEAGTEYAQTWMEQIGKGQVAGNDLGKSWDEANTNEAAKERLESMAQGFVGGAGAHVVSKTIQTPKQQENAIRQRSTKEMGSHAIGNEGVGGTGESSRVGSSQQGTEVTGKGEPEEVKSEVQPNEEKKVEEKSKQIVQQPKEEPAKPTPVEQVTFIKKDKDGTVYYNDTEGNNYEAKPSKGKKSNYDILKNGKPIEEGAKRFSDIQPAIELHIASEKSVAEYKQEQLKRKSENGTETQVDEAGRGRPLSEREGGNNEQGGIVSKKRKRNNGKSGNEEVRKSEVSGDVQKEVNEPTGKETKEEVQQPIQQLEEKSEQPASETGVQSTESTNVPVEATTSKETPTGKVTFEWLGREMNGDVVENLPDGKVKIKSEGKIYRVKPEDIGKKTEDIPLSEDTSRGNKPIENKVEPHVGNQFIVKGDNYSIKSQLIELGGRYDKKAKGYVMPETSREATEELVNQTNGRAPQAQHAADRSDGRTPKQVEVASRKIGRTGLDSLLKRLQAKFSGIQGVVTDKQKFEEAWRQYLNQGKEIQQETPPPQFEDSLPSGFIYKDQIYINPETARMDTPIHEFGHLWWNVVKHRYPELYKAGQQLIKGSAYHKEVTSNLAYSGLNENGSLDEAIVQAIGEKGALYANKSKWAQFWSDLWSKVRQALGIKTKIDMGSMNLNDLVSMAGKELLTPGEIGHLSSLRMPETGTLRLKEFKLPADAMKDWNKRIELQSILSNFKSNEWSTAAEDMHDGMASGFLRGIVDKTRPMQEVQNEIVNFHINKLKKEVDDNKSLSDKEKKKLKDQISANKSALAEKLIGDSKDVHGLMDLMTGKTEAEIKRFHKWLWGKPTSESGYGSITEFLTKNTDLLGREKLDKDSFAYRAMKEGITLLDIGFYGQVLHSPDYNAHKRSIGETQNGSGMTDEEAAMFLDEIKKSGKLEVLDKLFQEAHQKLVKDPLRLRLQEGIITQKDFDILNNYYKNYVPLNVSELSATKTKEGTAGGLSKGLFGSGIKKAKGSDKYKYWERINPMVQMVSAYEKTLADIELNKVYQAMLKLVQDNPNEKVWDVIKPKVVVTPEMNMETGDVDYKIQDYGSKADKKAEITSSLGVRVKGKQIFIHLKDKHLREMFLDNRPMHQNNAFLKGVFKAISTIQTYQRLTYIGLNIDFPLTNLQRDFQDAAINLQQHNISGISRKIISNVPKAMVAIAKEEIGKSSDPNISMMRHYMEEMEAEGGTISWLDMAGAEKVMTDVQKEIEKFNNAEKIHPGSMLLAPTRKMMQAVVIYNKMMEGALRLSTYANLREAGVSTHKAAKAAKNVTTNFNRKGSWGSWLNAAYLFANAGIQGTATLATTLMKSKTARRIIVGTIIAQIVNRALLDKLAEDDEDVKKLLSDADHNKNYILYFPHGKSKVLMIPTSYNQRAFKSIADGIYDLSTGKKDVSETGISILDSFYKSLVPMSESGLVPTLVVPVVEIQNNKSYFTGKMIYPEKKTLGQRDSDLYWKHTSKPFINIAKGMSNLMEGNDDIMEVSPAVMEYAFDYALGGLKSYYRFGDNLLQYGQGEPFDWNKMPIIRRNVLDLSTQQDQREASKLREYWDQFQKKRINQDQMNEFIRLRTKLIKEGKMSHRVKSPRTIYKIQAIDFHNLLQNPPDDENME